jgi:predicted O-methyltransferase YrrM
MNDFDPHHAPAARDAIVRDTTALGFDMISEPRVGALLAVFAASKPGGRFLEIGTGTGHGTAWILSGMDADSRLVSVDTDPAAVAVAERHLGSDPRVVFHIADGAEFIARSPKREFDLIYADAWPGKFTLLDDALELLLPGGIYVIDDLLPQKNWPEGHAAKVPLLIQSLEGRCGFASVKLDWASGLMVVVRGAGE